jgi:hypothetical protein
MSKKRILFLFILTFFLTLGDSQGQTQEGDTNDYVIEIERPVDREEVRREFDAKGTVIVKKQENIRQDMVLVSVIRPATYPRYYIQSRSKLKFVKSNSKYETSWLSHCWVGAPSDYGKKFYVYFFLMGTKSLREIEDMDESSNEEGIGKEEFETDFIDYPNKYYAKTKPVPIYRKFEWKGKD